MDEDEADLEETLIQFILTNLGTLRQIHGVWRISVTCEKV